MKILITGGSGFVGSRLANLYKEKYEVWAPSHQEFDFTEFSAARSGIERFRPDVLLHCAAISDVGTCEKNPELSMKVNVTGTKNLAECCAESGIKFVYCSSDQVYVRQPYPGESKETYLEPWKEEDAQDPAPLYGKHKLLAEQLCQQICPDSVGLRLTWMYGTLTEKEASAGRRNMEVILREAIEKGQQITLSATDFRAVTDIEEVVRNMEKAWQLPGGVYNYGSTACGPIYDTVCQAFEKAGIRVTESGTDTSGESGVQILKNESGNLRNLTMNTDKLRASGISFDDTKTALVRCICRIIA